MERLKIKEEIFNFLKEHIGFPYGPSRGGLQYNSIEIMAKGEKWKYYDVLGDFFQSGILVANRGGEFFSITKKGMELLENNEFDIFDPEAYLMNFENIDNITSFYLSEAIHCFNKDLYLSTIMALGTASESLILELAKFLFKKTNNQKELGIINSNYYSVSSLIRKINETCKDKKIKDYKEKYEIAIMTFANIFREYRNDYNHPKKSEIDKTLGYSLLDIFKTHYKKIVELREQINKI